jgi:predicted glycosyltransferase
LVDNKVTKNNYRAAQAKELINKYKEKGIEAKLVLYRKNVKIFDLVELYVIEYYMEEQVDNG